MCHQRCKIDRAIQNHSQQFIGREMENVGQRSSLSLKPNSAYVLWLVMKVTAQKCHIIEYRYSHRSAQSRSADTTCFRCAAIWTEFSPHFRACEIQNSRLSIPHNFCVNLTKLMSKIINLNALIVPLGSFRLLCCALMYRTLCTFSSLCFGEWWPRNTFIADGIAL